MIQCKWPQMFVTVLLDTMTTVAALKSSQDATSTLHHQPCTKDVQIAMKTVTITFIPFKDLIHVIFTISLKNWILNTCLIAKLWMDSHKLKKEVILKVLGMITLILMKIQLSLNLSNTQPKSMLTIKQKIKFTIWLKFNWILISEIGSICRSLQDSNKL